MTSSTTSIVADFWKKLNKMVKEETSWPNIANFVDAQIFVPKRQFSTQAKEILDSKNPKNDLSLMECLCQGHPGPMLRDLLDDLIAKGAPVTKECWMGVLQVHDNWEELSYDMILALMKSGFLPESFDDELPLDHILGCMRDSVEESALLEFFLPDFIREVVKTKIITLKEGVSHAAEGAFVECLTEAEEFLEDDLEDLLADAKGGVKINESKGEKDNTQTKPLEEEPEAKRARVTL